MTHARRGGHCGPVLHWDPLVLKETRTLRVGCMHELLKPFFCISRAGACMGHSDTRVSRSDARISRAGACMGHSDTRMRHSAACMGHSDTRMCHPAACMGRSDVRMSHSAARTRHQG